jgi:hypothetical protein
MKVAEEPNGAFEPRKNLYIRDVNCSSARKE